MASPVSSDGGSRNYDSGFSGPASSAGFSMKEAASEADHGTDLHMLHCTVCGDLLTEPLLLDCLHNCCRQCMDAASVKQGTPSVVVCRVCTDVTDAAIRRENLFIELQLQRHRTAVEQPKCGFCSEEGLPEQAADLWCSHCEKHLCHGCDPGHRKYNKHHLTISVLEMSERPSTCSSGAVTQLCRQHKKSMDHLCIQCELPKCHDCGLACSAMQHDLQFLKSPKTDNFLSKVKEEIMSFDRLLQDKAATLKLHVDLMEDLHSARREHLKLLRQNKKAVLESIDRTYEVAEESLQDKYDDLLTKAQGLVSAAEKLHTKASHALRYAERIAGSVDAASFIQQEKVLRTRLRLLTEKLKAVRKPLDAAECISIEATTFATADMDEVVRKWIGVPEVATDDLCSKVAADDGNSRTLQEPDQLSSNNNSQTKLDAGEDSVQSWTQDSLPRHDSGTDSDDDGSSSSEEAENAVMRVGAHCWFTEESTKCFDVAATGCNTVLIAQGTQGLVEIDYVENNTVSTWRAYSPKSVTAVDTIDDDNIVIGLSNNGRVALLTRNNRLESWKIVWFSEHLYDDPFTLAVNGDVIAVTLARTDLACNQKIYSGATLVLLSLSDRVELLREDLAFNISTVAVTENIVAAASDDYDRSAKGFFMDGYDHSGNLLWQQTWTTKVCGMCEAPSGRFIYVAAQKTNCVSAIREDDGQWLMDVMIKDSAIKSPFRISVSGNEDPSMLTVLEHDRRTVVVYPVIAYADIDE